MTKNDFLKLRIKKFIQTKNLKSIAEDYLPVNSDYYTNPKLYKKRDAILNEMNNRNIIEDNYEAILAKVDALLG